MAAESGFVDSVGTGGPSMELKNKVNHYKWGHWIYILNVFVSKKGQTYKGIKYIFRIFIKIAGYREKLMSQLDIRTEVNTTRIEEQFCMQIETPRGNLGRWNIITQTGKCSRCWTNSLPTF